jgi:hypothetical protein
MMHFSNTEFQSLSAADINDSLNNKFSFYICSKSFQNTALGLVSWLQCKSGIKQSQVQGPVVHQA